jgi:hypothetical protein
MRRVSSLFLSRSFCIVCNQIVSARTRIPPPIKTSFDGLVCLFFCSICTFLSLSQRPTILILSHAYAQYITHAQYHTSTVHHPHLRIRERKKEQLRPARMNNLSPTPSKSTRRHASFSRSCLPSCFPNPAIHDVSWIEAGDS